MKAQFKVNHLIKYNIKLNNNNSIKLYFNESNERNYIFCTEPVFF